MATQKKTDLSDFLLPNINSLREHIGFGTQVDQSHNDGSLTVTEFADDLALPFKYQGLEVLSGEYNTTDIARNCGFLLKTSDTSLVIGNALKVGLRVEVTNGTSDNLSITYPKSSSILAQTDYIPSGKTWIFKSTILETGTGKYCWKMIQEIDETT